MSYSAVNSIQACGDTLSTLNPKPPSPSMTTTGRSRPNRLCFRRTLSCSAMSGSKLNVGPSSRCKNNQGVLSKQPAINVISEESCNLSEEVFSSNEEPNIDEKCCTASKKNNEVILDVKEPTTFQTSPKKSSESNYSLPVISVTCEDQPNVQNTISCDNHPSIEISVEPPSPSRRTRSVPGALLADTGTRPRTGSAPGQISSCNFLMVPESFRNGVEHISHLVDPNPCCHFCKEPSQQPIHEDCTRLTIVSGGNVLCPMIKVVKRMHLVYQNTYIFFCLSFSQYDLVIQFILIYEIKVIPLQ